MDNPSLWKLLIDAWDLLTRRFEPVVEQHCMEHGLNLRSWALLLAVKTIEPEATSPAHLLIRVPYASAELYQERLELVREKGSLEMTTAGSYRLSRQGSELMHHLVKIARDEMARVDPLAPGESQKLALITNKLVENSMAQNPPPDTWAIRLSAKLLPELDPPLPFTEQAFSALGAYRDDSHLTAWKNTNLSATAFETLTLLWRGEVNSLEGVCRKLAHRGHATNVYADSLRDLMQRGFINRSDGDIVVTPAGRLYRGDVEEYTDYYFYKPWNCLAGDERIQLADLLKQLRAGLLVEN